MGCFNVACGISNLSIGAGDPVVLFPIVAQGTWTETKDGGYRKDTSAKLPIPDTNLIYTHCLFQPIVTPIRGEYDDYGCVENIVPSEGTEALENYFGMSADKLQHAVTRYGIDDDIEIPEEKKDIFKRMSGMYIHGHIYDAMVNETWLDGYEKTWAEDGQKNLKAILEKFISKLQEKDNLITLKNKAEAAEDNEKLKEVVELLMYNNFDIGRCGDMDLWTKDWFRFKDIYEQSLKEGKVVEEVLAYQRFHCNMYSCNRFFFPTMNGEQHGNTEASLRLVEKSKDILYQRIKQSFEWNGEDSEFFEKYKFLMGE